MKLLKGAKLVSFGMHELIAYPLVPRALYAGCHHRHLARMQRRCGRVQ
jgi:hypothetical protein